MRYRLLDGTRYNRFENGKLVKYKAGTAMDVVELDASESARFAPGRIVPVEVPKGKAEEVREVIKASTSSAEVRAIKDAEVSSDKPRSTVIAEADKKLEELSPSHPSHTVHTPSASSSHSTSTTSTSSKPSTKT